MKILHLYSDCRVTGPAYPVIELCQALTARGHDVTLAYRDAPVNPKRRSVGQIAEAAGLHTTSQFKLNRYIGLTDTVLDVARLPGYLRRERFDIVHTHLSHDHMIGCMCVRLAGGQKSRPKLVRTLHRRDVLPPNLYHRMTLSWMSDGLVTFTPGFREAYLERYRLPPQRIAVVPPAINTGEFDPDRGPFRDLRQELGIDPGAVVIGIVGRYQTYRRMDLFIEAAARLAPEHPSVRWLVVGGSRQLNATVRQPVERLKLQDRVIIAGHRRGAEYLNALAAMDIFTLLVPGSDGTARAVREAMSMAKPCVVSDFGMLPELVPDGVAGKVVAMDPDRLAAGWRELVQDPELRRRLGRQARQHAITHFDPVQASARMEAFYQQLVHGPQHSAVSSTAQ